MSKVTFDYSKASGFVSEEEVGYMSKLVDDAKQLLVSKAVPEMIFLGGLIYRLIMTKKNLRVFRRQRSGSSRTPRYWL